MEQSSSHAHHPQSMVSKCNKLFAQSFKACFTSSKKNELEIENIKKHVNVKTKALMDKLHTNNIDVSDDSKIEPVTNHLEPVPLPYARFEEYFMSLHPGGHNDDDDDEE